MFVFKIEVPYDKITIRKVRLLSLLYPPIICDADKKEIKFKIVFKKIKVKEVKFSES